MLTIETDFVQVQWFGPHRAAQMAVLGIDRPIAPVLRVDAGVAPVHVTLVEEDGRTTSWTKGQPGPRFHESTRYRVVVTGKLGDAVPVVSHRDPGLLREVAALEGKPIVVGHINFTEHVGLTEVAFSVGGHALRMVVEVFPTKLDYADDFRDLLHEVNGAARGLAFEYLRSTFLSVGADVVDENTGLEWLTLLRHHVERLETAMAHVNQHPRRALYRGHDTVRVERVRRVDGVVRAALRKRATRAGVPLDGVGNVPERILAPRALETLDTSEHRWIKHHLELVRDRLARISEDVRLAVIAAEGAGRAAVRLRAELAEVSGFRDRVTRLAGLDVLRQASAAAMEPGFSSLTLMMAPGYSETFQSLVALRLGLSVAGGALEVSPKELDVLYESWCFIRLAQLIAECCAATVRLDEILTVSASGIRVRLAQGKQSSVGFREPGRTLQLTYNRAFDGLTGTQRPDIVLELLHDGWPEIIIVFDAKYRVDTSDEYLRTYGQPGPPVDAVNALHRYRDAIALGAPSSPRGRPVVKAVALFPLTAAKAGDFKTHSFCQALDVLGIGALPFLPDATAQVAAWLRATLTLGPDQLAVPGPPWLALARGSI